VIACQRWQARRAYYRVCGEQFNPAHFGVDLVSDRDAREFVQFHHYAGSYVVAVLAVGLYEKRPFATDRLVGVAAFSVPINNYSIPKYTGIEPRQGVELGRFVLLDEIPANAETWFLARAFALLARLKPHIGAVISYADPVPRRTRTGEIVLPGHVGIIYQAFNARYHQRSKPRYLWLDQNGRVVNERMLSKLRNQERGAERALQRLRAVGAPAPFDDETPPEYVRRALSSGPFIRMRHSGNHVYSWPVGTPAIRRNRLLGFAPHHCYPKTIDQCAPGTSIVGSV